MKIADWLNDSGLFHYLEGGRFRISVIECFLSSVFVLLYSGDFLQTIINMEKVFNIAAFAVNERFDFICHL